MVDTAWTFAVIFMVIFAALATFAALWIKAEHENSAHRHGPQEGARFGRRPRR